MAKFTNLGEAFSDKVTQETIGLIDLSGTTPREFSYADLRRLSAGVARGLVRRGLKPGDAVAALAANRIEFLLAAFGALRAGMIAVPVNHKLPAASIAFILRDCKAKLAFCDDERAALCPADLPKVLLDEAGPNGYAAFCDPGEFTSVEPDAGDAAMVIYTSGSTGAPKGVVFSHLGHLWALDQRSNSSAPQGQRTIVAAPLYHQNGLASVQATLASGGTTVLLPGFTARSFIEAVAAYKVRMITAVPTMIAMVARERDLVTSLDLSGVKLVRVSSAPSTPALMASIREIFPNAAVVNGFGITEGGPVFFGPHPAGLPQPEMSVGYPHPEVQLRLVRDDAVVEDEGMLQIRSPAVMMGYLNKPELTAKVMTGDGYYITSDVFQRDSDGFFYFVRRADDMFVCGGENVFPGEVEAVLLKHPDIDQACVVPIDDEIKGQKPVAFVVLKPGHTASEDAIKRYSLANAPAYQHPRRVWFLPELPLASTNKVDRRLLAERAAASL